MKYFFYIVGIILVMAVGNEALYWYDNRPFRDTSETENIETDKPVSYSYQESDIPSPSGERIALVKYKDNEYSKGATIYIKNNGSDAEQSVFHTRDIFRELNTNPKWLGEEHLVFSAYCGTSCQGIVLLNIETGSVQKGVFSFTSTMTTEGTLMTHFKAWSGQEFALNGIMDNYYSEKDAGRGTIFVITTHTPVSGLMTKHQFIFDEKTGQLTLLE